MVYTDDATHSFGTTADLNMLIDAHNHKAGFISIKGYQYSGDSKTE